MITSPSNPKIKEFVRLRDGKHRRRTGLFPIDGDREIRRALQSGIRITEVFAVEERAGEAEKLGGSLHLVSTAVFEKIAFGNRLDGILVVAETPSRALDEFDKAVLTQSCPLLAVLESVEKPGNVGAIFRSADGAGLGGVMITDPLTDLFNPNTIRSSLGTVFELPATCADAATGIDRLRRHGISLAVARCDGAIPYTDYDFRKPTAIVLGGEAEGLSDRWQGSDVTAIKLPMAGIADSLNVSSAAAVLFYEARRQRS